MLTAASMGMLKSLARGAALYMRDRRGARYGEAKCCVKSAGGEPVQRKNRIIYARGIEQGGSALYGGRSKFGSVGG